MVHEATNYAAWAGFALGAANFILGIVGKRPVAAWRKPQDGEGTDRTAVLSIANTSKSVLAVVDIRVFALRHGLRKLIAFPMYPLGERDRMRDIFATLYDGRFTPVLLGPGKDATYAIRGCAPNALYLVMIRWPLSHGLGIPTFRMIDGRLLALQAGAIPNP